MSLSIHLLRMQIKSARKNVAHAVLQMPQVNQVMVELNPDKMLMRTNFERNKRKHAEG